MCHRAPTKRNPPDVAARRRPRNPAGLLLWPGAGTDSSHPSLKSIEDGITEMPVCRLDFQYRKDDRKAPDRAPKLIASVVEEVERVAGELDVSPDRLVIGGRSMGGRMCSMAIAEGLKVAGVVLIAYPLHPPGKPEKMRTEHLPELRGPSLWLCGDRDPFGSPEEIAEAQQMVSGQVTSRTLKGRHDLKTADAAILAEIRDWLGLDS